jgi:hypothetical protein
MADVAGGLAEGSFKLFLRLDKCKSNLSIFVALYIAPPIELQV